MEVLNYLEIIPSVWCSATFYFFAYNPGSLDADGTDTISPYVDLSEYCGYPQWDL